MIVSKSSLLFGFLSTVLKHNDGPVAIYELSDTLRSNGVCRDEMLS